MKASVTRIRSGFSPILKLALVCVVGLLGVSGLTAVADAGDATQATSYRSPLEVAFSPDGSKLATSDHTLGQVHFVDVNAAQVTSSVEVQGKPNGIAWLGDGKLMVAEYDAGTVAEIDAETGKVLRRLAVGPKPVGIAVAPKRNLLVACDYGLHSVYVVDLDGGETRAKITTPRHPFFVAVTPDESMAVVGNLLPEGPTNDPMASAAISLIDLESLEKVADILLPDGSANVRHVAVSPEGRWAYIAHTRGRVALPTTQLERGWVNTNSVSIIDLQAKAHYATLLLDLVTEGAADPWGVALSADGKTAWVTVAGAHQVTRLEVGRLHQLMAGKGAARPVPKDLAYAGTAAELWEQIRQDSSKRELLAYRLDALYVENLIRRVSIPAQGPRGVAVAPDGKHLAVASYFSGELLLLDPETCKVVQTISLGNQPAADLAREGDRIFHDATMCFQHWLSCATCHPDGRADGMNWDLLNDGIGNPKNARSMLLADRTPPMMSLGVRDDFEVATESGFKHILFRQPEPEQVKAVATYIASLEPERSPHLVKGSDGQHQLSPAAAQGKQIFEETKAGCTSCHLQPLLTDLGQYDVGTRHELDRQDKFDTPTLIELWRTGPYLHDGSARTLKDVFAEYNREDKHGMTSDLSPEELDALVQYLLAL